MVICQSCGKENCNDKAFCLKCGRNISIHNLLNDAFKEKEVPDGVWFYRHNNGSIHIGTKIKFNFIFAISILFTISSLIMYSYIFYITNDGLMRGILIAFSIPSIIHGIYIILLTSKGKINFQIDSKSYVFSGIGSFGLKREFNWNKIERIIFAETGNIQLLGRENIKVKLLFFSSFTGRPRIDFLVESLNYLIEKKHKVVEVE